jgi:ABC-type transport system involved in multi-copper enzyme maturation permease subunit
MRAITILAGLTVKEAMRRRIYIGAFCIALLFLGLLFLPGFAARGRSGITLDPSVQASLLILSGLGMIKFFSAVLGITLAAGAVATELERGTLYVILSKPLSRWQIVLGKWLGLVLLTAVNVAIWATLLWVAVYLRVPGPQWPMLKAVGLAFLYPLIFVTLTLCFSTFSSNVLATALSLVAIGIGWQEGFMRQMGRIFDIELLQQFGAFAGYLVPIGRLHRWMVEAAELQLPFGSRLTDQMIAEAPPVPGDLAYIGAYIAGALLLALLIFSRRDV